MSMRKGFQRFAESVAHYSGRPMAFVLAFVVVLAWAVTGPIFHFGDTWQLVINTGTTIITFLMVFLIQNTQNRDSAAVHIKLDELIRSSQAHNALLNLEELDEQTLDRIRRSYCRLAEQARAELERIEDEDDPFKGESEDP